MDILVWGLAGGFAGWIAIRYIGANEFRGVITSIIIGICGGCFGGSVLAPLLGESTPMSDAFNLFALVMALASAAVFLTVSDLISKRFGI